MRVTAIDAGHNSASDVGDGGFNIVPAATAVDPVAPRRFYLARPAPNPSHARLTLAFSLAAPGPASLAIIDLSGRVVRTLVAGSLAAGPHRVGWDGRDAGGRVVRAGTYFVRLVAGDGRRVERMVRL